MMRKILVAILHSISVQDIHFYRKIEKNSMKEEQTRPPLLQIETREAADITLAVMGAPAAAYSPWILQHSGPA